MAQKRKKKVKAPEPEIEIVNSEEEQDEAIPAIETELVSERELDSLFESLDAEDDSSDGLHARKSDTKDSKLLPIARPSGALVRYTPLDAYLADIRRFSPMSREEEHEVALDYQATKNPEAAYKLVSSNLWLVVKIARDYERVARNLLDLIQEGNIGLMEAVKNFDPYRGVRFPSYAVWWVKAYIIRFIIANWRLVKIGTTQAQRKLFFNLKKESDRLEREGVFPTAKLLADRLSVKEGDVIEMSQRLGSSDMSVDAPLGDDSDNTLLSVMPNNEQSVEEKIVHDQMGTALRHALKKFEQKLNVKEIAIYNGRIVSEDKLTLQELSDKLLISKERVRQIENKIREKLQVFVRESMGDEIPDWVGSEV